MSRFRCCGCLKCCKGEVDKYNLDLIDREKKVEDNNQNNIVNNNPVNILNSKQKKFKKNPDVLEDIQLKYNPEQNFKINNKTSIENLVDDNYLDDENHEYYLLSFKKEKDDYSIFIPEDVFEEICNGFAKKEKNPISNVLEECELFSCLPEDKVFVFNSFEQISTNEKSKEAKKYKEEIRNLLDKERLVLAKVFKEEIRKKTTKNFIKI